mmetsp:Transcript_6531/g.14752  ORF Transcript_6531/g.14752 Transcript_6531/m.14752 type:complete len:233 (+) Transcript_6531:388-1086(+)
MHLVPETSIAHHEGKEQLMVLEQTHADLRVDKLCEVLDDDLNALLGIITAGTRSQALFKKAGEELQAVLIHGIDVGQIGHHEINDGSPGGTGPQDFRHLINLFHTLLRRSHAFLTTVARFLGLVQGYNQGVIGQQIISRLAEQFQDQLLQSIHLCLVGRNLHHQIGPELRQVRPFVLDHVRNQLVLKAEQGDGEVDYSHLDANLWQVVWIRHLRGHKEAEVFVVRHIFTPKS